MQADGKTEYAILQHRIPPSQNVQKRAGGISHTECNAENKDRGQCASDEGLKQRP